MEPIIEEFTITLKYQCTVDTETGELTTKCISRQISKNNIEVTEVKKKTTKSKKVESTDPTLVLEENKYCINQAAYDLMQLSPDARLDVKYEKNGKNICPVIGTDEHFGTKGGNKITKSLTVACRGSKHDELAKYGTEFAIVPHPTREGIFSLVSKDNVIESDSLEEIEEQTNEDIDVDLQDLIDDKDANVEEVSSLIFKF
jgi:hypothetical protein